jgi:hypothetical protein
LLRKVLEPFTKLTTYMVDSAFLGYQCAYPFFCGKPGDVPVVRQCLCEHLKQKKDADNVWISEPCSDPAWYRANGFEVVGILPMVHVKVEGHATIASYLAALGKKRRKNFRRDRKLAEAHGTSIEFFAGTIPGDVLQAMHGCLLQSAARSTLCVPYEDLLNDRAAFMGQDQQALVARVNGSVVGFFSFFTNGDTLQQCHGGFDYQRSLQVKAYPNLINAAIEHAIQRGCKWITLGPLNNEAKRRAGTHLMPMMASLWCRSALLRFFMRKWLLRKLQVYAGELAPGDFPWKVGSHERLVNGCDGISWPISVARFAAGWPAGRSAHPRPPKPNSVGAPGASAFLLGAANGQVPPQAGVAGRRYPASGTGPFGAGPALAGAPLRFRLA